MESSLRRRLSAVAAVEETHGMGLDAPLAATEHAFHTVAFAENFVLEIVMGLLKRA